MKCFCVARTGESLYTASMQTGILGAYLHELRDLRGLTQEDVGDAIGVSNRMVGKWESGENEPKISNTLAVFRVLRGSLDDLLALESVTSPEEAKTIARQRYASGELLTDEDRALLSRLTPEQKTALLALVRQMRGHPR